MDFPISGVTISPLYLALAGFVIGVLGGFFGVGGSFLSGPILFAAGVPMNFVVGTDLAHIVGKSIVATRRHRVLGNVDVKLGMIMVLGTVAGVEVGAQVVQYLKRHSNADQVIGIFFIAVLFGISGFIGWESWKTIVMIRKRRKAPLKPGKVLPGRTADVSAFGHISKKVQSFRLPPMICLPESGIEQISLWVIIAVAFVGGIFSGFLGGGAGYLRMPSLVYLLGVPTHVAVGTDLFEIMISASYGTFTHAMKGNVDILIALVMHTGAAIGAQIGVALTQYFAGPRIRLAFVPLPIIGALVMIHTLLTGAGKH